MRVACHRILFAVLVSSTLSAGLFAGKGAELKPTHVNPGEVLLNDDASAGELGKKWTVNKGTWKIEEGMIVGAENPEDKHAAVLTLAQPHRNAIARFSFRVDDSKGFHLSFNHAKGHLFRIVAANSGLTITKDKDKKDPKSRPETLGSAEARFEPGTWYTMLVETRGDQVFVSTDNGVRLEGRHSGLDVDKTGYRFVKPGASLKLDDIRIWSVAP